MNRCPCGKSKNYARCCGRFIGGAELPRTPEQLMRSRYTAYALGGRGDYLLRTWFPATAKGLTAEQLSERKVSWQRLDVLDKSQQGDNGTVEFKAYFLPASASLEGSASLVGDSATLDVLHEISEFKRLQGRWYYVGARVE